MSVVRRNSVPLNSSPSICSFPALGFEKAIRLVQLQYEAEGYFYFCKTSQQLQKRAFEVLTDSLDQSNDTLESTLIHHKLASSKRICRFLSCRLKKQDIHIDAPATQRRKYLLG